MLRVTQQTSSEWSQDLNRILSTPVFPAGAQAGPEWGVTVGGPIRGYPLPALQRDCQEPFRGQRLQLTPLVTPPPRLPKRLISGKRLLFSLYCLSFLICKMGVIVTVDVLCVQDILCKWKWSTLPITRSSERPLALGPTGLRLLKHYT